MKNEFRKLDELIDRIKSPNNIRINKLGDIVSVRNTIEDLKMDIGDCFDEIRRILQHDNR